MRFRAEQHLRRQRDFRMAREQGRRIECGGFTLWYVQRGTGTSPQSEPALSATISDDVGAAANHAVPDVSAAVAPGSKVNRPLNPGPRVGVIASTAAVGGAVQRNRAKRRLREVFRHHQQQIPVELDLLLIARRSLNQLSYPEIEKKFLEACTRLPRKTEGIL